MAKSTKKARKKTVRKTVPRKATAKKTAKKIKALAVVEAFKPDIKHTMAFPFRVNDRDLFRPLREEIKAKLKKSGDAIELHGQPGQSYHELYNRLSSVMVRPEFSKPAKGMQYVRRQGLRRTVVGTPGISSVVLMLAKKGTKIPRGPRTKKTAK